MTDFEEATTPPASTSRFTLLGNSSSRGASRTQFHYYFQVFLRRAWKEHVIKRQNKKKLPKEQIQSNMAIHGSTVKGGNLTQFQSRRAGPTSERNR